MRKLFKTIFRCKRTKKVNPIAASIEINETSANTWWS